MYKIDDKDCENPELKINPQKGYKQQKFLHFVRDAVYSVAYALHDMHIENCGKNFKGLCSAHIDGETLLSYLTNVSFKGTFYFFYWLLFLLISIYFQKMFNIELRKSF